jgi:nucleotide-binding universal stress UspA family protein
LTWIKLNDLRMDECWRIESSQRSAAMFEVLVNTEEMRDDNPVVRTGLALASRLNAYATGLNIVEVFPATMAIPDVMTVLATQEQMARQCDAWWMKQCHEHGIKGTWEVIRGLYVPILARRSCMADITVSRMPNREAGYSTDMDHVTRVLLAAASPMLLVPSGWDGTFRPERVLVAWNSTPESMRALRAAVPFLGEAGTVRLVDGASDELPGIAPPPLPVRDWLTRQGIALQAVQQFPAQTSIGEALLDQAHAMKADLLVMGAWGHSRVSELMLGGTTRHVLKHAQLPVLLSH